MSFNPFENGEYEKYCNSLPKYEFKINTDDTEEYDPLDEVETNLLYDEDCGYYWKGDYPSHRAIDDNRSYSIDKNPFED